MAGSLIVIKDAIALPLTRFDPPGKAPRGSFDGGACFADGTPCQLGASRMINHDNTLSPAAGVPPNRLEGSHLWCGLFNNAHFGHFISESLARLWALDVIRPPASLVFFGRLPMQPLPAWAQGLLNLLAPGIPLTQLRAPLRLDRLVVPEQACLPSGVMRGDPLNRAFLHRRLLPDPAEIDTAWGPGPRRLYVSRSGLVNEAQILGEEQIERQMQAEGYRVIRPETLPLRNQLALYAGAERLVFAEGSALHVYALVCRPDQHVFVIWRRRETYGGFAAQITSFGGPELRGTSHISAVLVPQEAPGALARAHGIADFPALAAELRAEGFISAPTWPALSEEEIRHLIATRHAGFILT